MNKSSLTSVHIAEPNRTVSGSRFRCDSVVECTSSTALRSLGGRPMSIHTCTATSTHSTVVNGASRAQARSQAQANRTWSLTQWFDRSR
jgi:hypothetical protein